MAEQTVAFGVFHREGQQWVLAYRCATADEVREWLGKQADSDPENWMIAEGYIYPVLPAPTAKVFYAPAPEVTA